MIVAVFILLAIPAGFLLGGRLRNIKNYTTRFLGLPIAAFLLESAAPFLRNLLSAPVAQWHWMLVTAEYLLLILFCLLNWKSWPVWIIFTACMLNFFVIALFGFQMPVAPFARDIPQMAATIARIDSGELFRYTVANVNDPFWFLGDVIVIPIKRFGGLASVGDTLLGLGSAALFCTWMLTKKSPETAKRDPLETPKAA
jgi:hypothetical protein